MFPFVFGLVCNLERSLLLKLICRDGEAPIHRAAVVGDLSSLEFLVSRNAVIHVRDK